MDWTVQFDEAVGRYLPDLEVLREEPMSRHTTFRIGGPARRMAFPTSREQLVLLVSFAQDSGAEPLVIGNGSNLLVPDEGLDRLVIDTSVHLNRVEPGEDGTLTADAGTTLARTADLACRLGLTGLEFAHGIPGTVGGGVCMNAGAYGGEMKQVLRRAAVLFPEEGVRRETLAAASDGSGGGIGVFQLLSDLIAGLNVGIHSAPQLGKGFLHILHLLQQNLQQDPCVLFSRDARMDLAGDSAEADGGCGGNPFPAAAQSGFRRSVPLSDRKAAEKRRYLRRCRPTPRQASLSGRPPPGTALPPGAAPASSRRRRRRRSCRRRPPPCRGCRGQNSSPVSPSRQARSAVRARVVPASAVRVPSSPGSTRFRWTEVSITSRSSPSVRHQQIAAVADDQRLRAAVLGKTHQQHQLLPAGGEGHPPCGAADAGRWCAGSWVPPGGLPDPADTAPPLHQTELSNP